MLKPKSGPEIMLKMMGLGDLSDQVKELIDAGALQKIIAFADGVAEINDRLIRIERLLDRTGGNHPASVIDVTDINSAKSDD
jgi:hypothetical protein